MWQGPFGWLVGSVLVVLPVAAAWGPGGPDVSGQAGIRGPSGTCAILFNGRTFAAGVAPLSVATGDLDGDGDLDLAVVNLGSDDVSVLLGHGDGTFAADTRFGAGARPRSIAMGDLDGDGDLDLAVANPSSTEISSLFGLATVTAPSPRRRASTRAMGRPRWPWGIWTATSTSTSSLRTRAAATFPCF